MKKNNNIEFLYNQILELEDSAFIFDQNQFQLNIQNLYASFSSSYPKVNIGYSYKTNYLPDVCKIAHNEGCWAEVVSEMELDMALEYLEDSEKIIYNGPVKSYNSILKLIQNNGILNIDNPFDLEIINNILLNYSPKNKIKLALRVNFSYGSNDSRFGMDIITINDLKEKIIANNQLELIGYHIHLPFRTLESYEYRINCIFEVLKLHGKLPLKYINIGGGFYGNISDDLASSLGLEKVPKFLDYGSLIGNMLSKHFQSIPLSEWPDLFIEPGSSVVADAFRFISKIHSIKNINNNNIIISYTARHLITPTNKSVMLPIEFFSTENINDNSEKEYNYTVVGYTCIESDIIGFIKSNKILNQNDFLIINNVGSYTVVMGSDFILPQPSIYLIKLNQFKLLRKRKTALDIIHSFNSCN